MRAELLKLAVICTVLLPVNVSTGEDAPAAPPLIPVNPEVQSIVGRSVGGEVPVRQRRPRVDRQVQPAAAQAPAVSDPSAVDNGAPPPVPMEPDVPATPGATPAPAVVTSPPIPFAPQFSGPSAIHNRLRARRLARVQQMRRDAEAAGDAQGAQRAQYLEGMVNQLHEKGLFTFGQEVMGAIQQGKMNGTSIFGGGSASAPASASSVELPEADLGAPAALPGTELGEPGALPESDLGPPAPIPGGEAGTAPEAAAQPAPELPPASP
ncbi:MAG: hypothetical protein JNG89_04610 [Planctomycetaceae bacterium]|nr:hypothetical protein [Planctomycetaceae bacterium]